MPTDRAILAKLCRMYYLEDFTQDEIARRLGASKSSVSRLLKEAREKHIVTFHINDPAERVISLERRLEQVFGLKEAAVVTDGSISSGDALKTRVAEAGALLLQRRVQANDVIAISSGTTLAELAKALDPPTHVDIEVVPLLGGIDHRGQDIHANQIARRISEAFGGRHYVLNSPLVASSPRAKRVLEGEESIRVVLEKAKSANMALTGIGVAGETSIMVTRGYFSPAEFARVAKTGAVGDIATSFYDLKGDACEQSLDKRKVGLELSDLKRIPNVVGVAAGDEKRDAILGALRGCLLNMLVTNEKVAEYLIDAEAI